MKIVVTGASGFVGRMLVPRLAASGADIIAVGRDRDRLAELFHGIATVVGYDDIAPSGEHADLLVHLATLNNDSSAAPESFDAVNVDLMLQTAIAARDAGMARFLHFSSVHALDRKRRDPYAASKRRAAEKLRTVEGMFTDTVYLAAVHGAAFAGKLAPLNRLPRLAAHALFLIVSSLKPVTSVDRIAEVVLEAARGASGLDGAVVVDSKDHNPVYRLVRRLIDLATAFLVLAVGWPILALIWAAVKIETPGPGIYSQERTGQNGTVFKCHKFRSMHQGTKVAGTHEVSAASVTRMGAFLRRTKLDELPQAWNLLRNEMTLVGPRPCLPTQTDVINARMRRGVLAAKPGITGLAQINGVDMSEAETLAQCDRRYLDLRGLFLDLDIALATVTGRGQGDKTQA